MLVMNKKKTRSYLRNKRALTIILYMTFNLMLPYLTAHVLSNIYDLVVSQMSQIMLYRGEDDK